MKVQFRLKQDIPDTLLLRLQKHGFELPVRVYASYKSYDRKKLRKLMQISTKGNVAAAVLLAHVYAQKQTYDLEPNGVIETFVKFPKWLSLNSRTKAYTYRASKAARRHLRKLRKKLKEKSSPE